MLAFILLILAVDFPTDNQGAPLPEGALASISLPSGLFDNIEGDSVGIFFALYTEPTLFPVREPEMPPADPESTLRTAVGSPIVAATVGQPVRIEFNNIDPPIEINLRLMELSNGSVSD